MRAILNVKLLNAAACSLAAALNGKCVLLSPKPQLGNRRVKK
jgi:hypothetical protein